LSIHERDITSAVCQRCAKCCEIDIRVPNTDSRYRAFLRGVGLRISPTPSSGQIDCCDQVHEITLHLGPCEHLRSRRESGTTIYACALHGDARRPILCDHYNCVSWAKAHNRYSSDNPMLVAAQEALRSARSLAMSEVTHG